MMNIIYSNNYTAYAPGNLTGTRAAVFAGGGYGSGSDYRISKNIYYLYGYDVEGNKTQQVSSCIIDGMQAAAYTQYSRLGYPLLESTRYNYSGGFYETVISNQYDVKGNKTGASAYLGSFSPMMARAQEQGNNSAPQYIYNSLGQLSKLRLKNDIDYSYNLRGQVTGISSPAFSQTLKYDDGTTPCYNGNISEMTVAYGSGSAVTRRFSYDRLNRLTAQTSTDGYNTAYSYSLNSSPLTVMRYGMTSDGTVGVVDDLTMSYSGNRLSSVTDNADHVLLENSLDFPSDRAWFGYNADGNLNMDTSRDITGISYSPSGRPMAIDIFGDDRFEYSYDALNCKLAENYRNNNGLTTSRYYAGTLEFIKEPGDTALHLVRANLPWGYLTADGRTNAYIPDYQGNIRAVIDPDGTAIQTTDYYPYGLPMPTSTSTAQNRYKYSGNELETRAGLNFYNFNARMHYGDICMFGAPDVNSSSYPYYNPYLYCGGNPIKYVDKSGKYFVDATGAKVTYDSKTNTWSENATTDIKRYAEYLKMTNVGCEIFDDILKNDIATTIDFKDYYIDKGEINPGVFGATKVDYKSGKKANIVIFESAISKALPFYCDTYYTPKNKKWELRQILLINFKQFCSSICVHEGVHATDKNDRIDVDENDVKKISNREQRADEKGIRALWEFILQDLITSSSNTN